MRRMARILLCLIVTVMVFGAVPAFATDGGSCYTCKVGEGLAACTTPENGMDGYMRCRVQCVVIDTQMGVCFCDWQQSNWCIYITVQG
jgi:hypothetical protein